ncbi:MAG TPA: helical backbone metal receptor, partial [Casimicrobiaceae bacterium]
MWAPHARKNASSLPPEGAQSAPRGGPSARTIAANVDWAGIAHPRTNKARIASLVPSLTELLFALNLGANVVARTGFCVHPKPDVVRVPKIGGTKDPDLERLKALQPTHLVVNIDENRRETVDAARAFVPNIIVTDPRDPLDNRRLYRLIAAIFDREREAAALRIAFDEALIALDATVGGLPRQRVLYLIWRKPWMTVARDTYIGATLARTGLDTLPTRATRRYPELADDDPAWREADRLIVSSEPYAFRTRDADELAARFARPAHLIDGEWTSWYGSRA